MNTSEKAYTVLKNKIINNEISGNLSEQELCNTLHLSRTPLREALFRLISEGWIIYSKNKTKMVKPITLTEIKDIFQIRDKIEILVLQLGWRHKNLDKYEEIATDFNKYINKKDYTTLLNLNKVFHSQMLNDCNSELFFNMLSFVYDRLDLIHNLINNSKNDTILTAKEHLDICNGLLQGDFDYSTKAIMEHIKNSKKRLLTNFIM